ncbi:MAG: ABC transporter ATP-binding protein [Proteobacteria bacterium]|nr:ABC transporter ATP-binding protein [Pseudomonadota bacterium]
MDGSTVLAMTMTEATGPTPVLELAALTKKYGSVDAVSNVDLKLHEGEFLTLLGASGSGKSTILMMIAGFIQPTFGDIRLRGKSIVKTPPHKRRIGVVFQNYALFPHLTVYENVAFALRNARMAREHIDQRVQELLMKVRLEQLAHRLPSQLSGGQQQRVAIARALAIDPDILLFDEPLGALDKNLREHMVLELQRLHHQLGTTMVYVTHDQIEALVMSDRIAVMDAGRIVALGSPQELYDNPKTVFVAEFLGNSNILVSEDGRCEALRPERIQLGSISEGCQRSQGTVTEVAFLGDRVRYEVRLTNNQTIVVAVPRRQGIEVYEIGAQVTVGWHRADARPVTRDNA